jgi:hypothetical protein
VIAASVCTDDDAVEQLRYRQCARTTLAQGNLEFSDAETGHALDFSPFSA